MDLLKCLASFDLHHRPYHLSNSPDGEVVVACSPEGTVTLLSGSLQFLDSLELGEKVNDIAISPDGEHLGLSLRGRTCVLTRRGTLIREVGHEPWLDWAGGGCTFSPEGRYFWSVRPGSEGRSIRVEVVECEGWRTVAEEEFEAEEDGYWSVVPHPEGEVVGLWLGAGQDGQWLYWCGVQDDRMYLEEEPALAGSGPPLFHPAGGEFLTDSLQDESLRRHGFPSGRVLGRVAGSVAFPPDVGRAERGRFGGGMQYLSDRRALVVCSDGRMSSIDIGSRRFEGEVLLEGCPPRAHRFPWEEREGLYGDVEQALIIAGGRLVAAHRDWIDRPMNPDYTLRVWDLSPLCRAMRRPSGERPQTEKFFDHFFR